MPFWYPNTDLFKTMTAGNETNMKKKLYPSSPNRPVGGVLNIPGPRGFERDASRAETANAVIINVTISVGTERQAYSISITIMKHLECERTYALVQSGPTLYSLCPFHHPEVQRDQRPPYEVLHRPPDPTVFAVIS